VNTQVSDDELGQIERLIGARRPASMGKEKS
jgi:hypothetical protein